MKRFESKTKAIFVFVRINHTYPDVFKNGDFFLLICGYRPHVAGVFGIPVYVWKVKHDSKTQRVERKDFFVHTQVGVNKALISINLRFLEQNINIFVYLEPL